MTFLQKGGDELDLPLDVLGGSRLKMGGEHIELRTVDAKHLDPMIGELLKRDTFPLRVSNSLVIDIGNVAYVQDLQTRYFDDSAQYVFHNESPEIADVGRTVDGGSATVHAQCLPVFGNERTYLATHGVEEPEF